MKESPNDIKLEEMLRSSKLVHDGFMGTDTRKPLEVIETDRAAVLRAGYNCAQLSRRMAELTNLSKLALGGWVDVNENLRVRSEDYKGYMVCPWPHSGRFDKRVTFLERVRDGKTISWTDMNIHLIGEHGFFEGKGAMYRLEPEELIAMIF